jgi:RNA polymerase sigma-70 factor (ECF subfamily)
MSGNQSKAFQRLFEEHAEALHRYAYRIVRSREMAEDVVQDVFFRLWRVWDRIEIGAYTRAYLYVTTRSRALNHIKRELREERRRMTTVHGIVSEEAALPPEGETRMDADEIVNAIEQVLKQMPPRQREVAALRLRHQLTTREIAERLSISPRTVEVHIGRATKALREQLPGLLSGS